MADPLSVIVLLLFLLLRVADFQHCLLKTKWVNDNSYHNKRAHWQHSWPTTKMFCYYFPLKKKGPSLFVSCMVEIGDLVLEKKILKNCKCNFAIHLALGQFLKQTWITLITKTQFVPIELVVIGLRLVVQEKRFKIWVVFAPYLDKIKKTEYKEKNFDYYFQFLKYFSLFLDIK